MILNEPFIHNAKVRQNVDRNVYLHIYQLHEKNSLEKLAGFNNRMAACKSLQRLTGLNHCMTACKSYPSLPVGYFF